MSEAFEKIKAGLDEAAVIAPYVAEVERLTKERDAAIDRAEAAEAEVARLRQALHKDEHTVVIAYEDGDHQRLARGVGRLQRENDALRALLIETRPFVQDSVGFTHHELRARIAAATGDDNG